MRERPGDVSAWLRRQTPEHLDLLGRMHERLRAHLPTSGVPDREWCRVYNLYQQGYNHLLAEERERAKLALLASKSGSGQPLSDEDYESEMRALGLEAVKELPAEELSAELTRRGVIVPVVKDPD